MIILKKAKKSAFFLHACKIMFYNCKKIVYILPAVQNKTGEKHERNYWRFSSGSGFLCVFSGAIFILKGEKNENF
jgi:hypothetical protein